jgi:hypothetical protein
MMADVELALKDREGFKGRARFEADENGVRLFVKRLDGFSFEIIQHIEYMMRKDGTVRRVSKPIIRKA